jgi:porphobilinogen synthase
MSSFPEMRLRRLRRTESLRRLFRETRVAVDDLVCPVFVVPGHNVRDEIESMPGIFHISVDQIAREGEQIARLSIPAVLIFGLPENKDELGTAAYDSHGIVQTAVRELKREFPDLVVITDVCLCQYTSHGHCGLVDNGTIDNDRSVALLARTAATHAEAGADIVAPSDMMDGRVAAIREALDESGFPEVMILSYAAKYASAFYGPFREAADSAPQFGDRLTYQMDPGNAREALREIESDILEGADAVMVKPALCYLDVIRTARDSFSHPLAAYSVSGEFAMIKAASQKGWLDEQRATLELLTALKRAGADVIVTYAAKEAARWLTG